MKSTELPLPVALLTVVLSYAGATHAEGVRDVRQPSSLQQSVFEDDGYAFLTPLEPADESQPTHGNASDDHGTPRQEDVAGHDQGGSHESQGEHGGGEEHGEGHG